VNDVSRDASTSNYQREIVSTVRSCTLFPKHPDTITRMLDDYPAERMSDEYDLPLPFLGEHALVISLQQLTAQLVNTCSAILRLWMPISALFEHSSNSASGTFRVNLAISPQAIMRARDASSGNKSLNQLMPLRSQV